VQALVLIYSTLGVVGVFLGDLLMAAVDPRIKLSGGEGGKE
jgi:oligopeptide transport system permease protein